MVPPCGTDASGRLSSVTPGARPTFTNLRIHKELRLRGSTAAPSIRGYSPTGWRSKRGFAGERRRPAVDPETVCSRSVTVHYCGSTRSIGGHQPT